MRKLVLAALFAVLAVTGVGNAHPPTTAIGRAVEAFKSVSVSYEPGSIVTDVEAGNFPAIVGSNPKVAFMPASARSEIGGGADAIAEEIAREARLDGTLVVLVGTEVGAWSNDIGDDRLAQLVANTRTSDPGTSEASLVASLARSVQAEPVGNGVPWGWIGVVLLALALGALVAFDRLGQAKTLTSR